MRKRAEKLQPYYNSLQASIASDSARSLFPPFSNFLLFTNVKSLYEPEDADPTLSDLNQVRQGILSEADAFAHAIQRAFLGRLVKANMDLRKLEGAVATTSSNRYADAPLVSANDAFALAKEITSVVKCPKKWCTTYATFPAILDHVKVCETTSALTEDALSTTPAQIAAVRHIVESASKKVSETSTASLYALGRAFLCSDCEPKNPLLGAAAWSSYSSNPPRDWAGMLSHLLKQHAPPANGPQSFPALQFTPPAAPSPGQANPGGFVVDPDSPQSQKGEGAAV
ncbi:hypothetical protein B0A53_03084 [Rhodotorula sp. CCFEE 5036]|nr:hypothetical protein B0A53_03084 [Rhodotorula sp. CCFEE 5036]